MFMMNVRRSEAHRRAEFPGLGVLLACDRASARAELFSLLSSPTVVASGIDFQIAQIEANISTRKPNFRVFHTARRMKPTSAARFAVTRRAVLDMLR